MNQSFARAVLVSMSLLFMWGIVCTLYGSRYRSLAPSVQRYCAQMTLYWGIINTILGAVAIVTVLLAWDKYSGDVTTQQGAKHIFKINAGLDVAYMGIGVVTAYVGRAISDRRRGFGLAIVIQGAVLLMLDGTLSMIG